MDVGENTTLSNGDVAKQLVQLLIVSDGELQMSGNDTTLLVVSGSVTGQLENLDGEVLKDGSEVDGGTSTNSLGVVSLSQESVDSTNGEGKIGLSGSRLGGLRRGGGLATGLSTGRHCVLLLLLLDKSVSEEWK